jgi:hypothetical protein
MAIKARTFCDRSTDPLARRRLAETKARIGLQTRWAAVGGIAAVLEDDLRR